jgi:hypothetical protein
MTTFPALIPSTRTYSPGAFPHTAHRVYDGSEARVRHSSTVFGVRLRLFFPALSTADLLTVIGHYAGQSGRFLPFAIPNDLLSGVTTPADFTPAGHQWRYAAKPTVEDISIVGGTNLHNLTVELETVPPENTIAQGARLRVRASLQAGSAQLGEFFNVYAWLDAGAGSVLDPFLVTATLAAGAASAVGDPDFASVSLLLPMDGTNGSTTFTDASSNALTVTSTNAVISTAQSRWGSSSALFNGTNSYVTVDVPGGLGAGTFTLEWWIYPINTGAPGAIFNSRGGGGNNGDGIDFFNDHKIGTAYVVILNTGPTYTPNTWHHFALVRESSSNMRAYLNGVNYVTSNSSNNFSNTQFHIGGSPAGNIGYFNGYMDDVRYSNIARYTANFTPPSAPFPTS